MLILQRLLPVIVDPFDYTIEKPGAKYAFEVAFHNTTTTQIEPEGFKKIEDIPCLIIRGKRTMFCQSNIMRSLDRIFQTLNLKK